MKRYTIHAQGYCYGPVFDSKKAALDEMKLWAVEDYAQVKQRYGKATKKTGKGSVAIYIGNKLSTALWSSYAVGQTI